MSVPRGEMMVNILINNKPDKATTLSDHWKRRFRLISE